jgi:hypothetical protein
MLAGVKPLREEAAIACGVRERLVMEVNLVHHANTSSPLPRVSNDAGRVMEVKSDIP